MSRLKELDLDLLFKSILSLQSEQECYQFFEDLCTVQELRAISQRMNVAKMLSEQYVYNDIVEKTGASTATISRVNRSLNYGSNGYKTVLERLKD